MGITVRTLQRMFGVNPQSGLRLSHHGFSHAITALAQVSTKILQEGTSGRLFIICQEVSKGHLHEGYGRRSGQAMWFQFTSPDGNHAGFFNMSLVFPGLHLQFWA